MATAIRLNGKTQESVDNPVIVRNILAQVASTSVTDTSYTLQTSDVGNAIDCDNASPITLTVPKDTFEVGQTFEIAQIGSGQVTVTGAVGVTVNGSGGLVATSGQYAVIAIRQVSINVFIVYGDRA